MNLLQLQYFYVVAQEQGFTNASKALRIQQPAVSRMVQLLEEDLGFDLFEKIGRNVRLTAKGQEVFDHCKSIFGAVELLKQSLGQIDDTPKGTLLMGASEPIASHYIPNILADYLKRYPSVYPNIFSAPASDLFDRILKGYLELGLFFHTPELPESLEIFKSLDVKYHLVVRKDLKKNKLILSQFIGSREIDDTATKKFPTLDRIKLDLPNARITISSNNLTAHRSMTLQGLGVAVLPDFLVREDLAAGRLARVYPKEEFKFKLKFIKRKTAILSLAAIKFIESCSSQHQY